LVSRKPRKNYGKKENTAYLYFHGELKGGSGHMPPQLLPMMQGEVMCNLDAPSHFVAHTP